MTTQHRPPRINYARPSFIEGMARLLDIGGTLNQHDADDLMEMRRGMRVRRLAQPSDPEADAEEIRQVWLAVGQDIRDAMGYREVDLPGDPKSEEQSE